MRKVLVDQDDNGNVYNPYDGVLIGCILGVQLPEHKESEGMDDKISGLVKLKSAGFTAEEIILLNNAGL